MEFPKTSGYKRKQELTRQIASVYREESSIIKKEGMGELLEIHETMQKVKNDLEMFNNLMDLSYKGVVVSYLLRDLYETLAKKYENFANSFFLYFKKESELKDTLENLKSDLKASATN